MTKTAGTISTMKFVCDYCNLEITSSPIYTETKVFAGRKISDLLQIVSNFSLPTNFRIELCNVCASNLIIATSLIVKTQKLIDNSLKKMETIDQNKNEEEELNQLDVQLVDLKENGSPPYPNECKPIDLTNAVQLLPSNDKPKENQSLVQLFGASIASNIKERKSKEVEDLTSEHETKEVTTIDNSYVKDFGCRLCDFKGMEAESLKKHLKSVHQLQRPRIFFCNVCPKSFGLIKTLSTHLLTHGIINPQDTANSQEKMTKKKLTATKRLALVEEPKSKEVPSSSVPIVIQKMIDHTNTSDCNVQDIEENEIEITLEDTEKKDKPIDQSNKVQILSVEVIKKPIIIQSIENNFSSKSTIFKSLEKQTEQEDPKTPNNSLALSMEIKSSPRKIFKAENTIDLNNAETFYSSSNEKSPTKSIEKPEDLTNELKYNIVKQKLDSPLYYDDKTKKTSIIDVEKVDESFDCINHEVMPLKKSKTASSKTTEDVVDCTQCGKTFNSLKSLQSHIQKMHNQIIKCPINCLEKQTEQEDPKTPNHSFSLSMEIESSPTKISKTENTIDLNNAETFYSSSNEKSPTTSTEKPEEDLTNESKYNIVKRKLDNPLYYDDKSKKTSITDVGKFYESFDGINHEVMPLKKSKTASSKTNEDVVDCTQCGKTVSSLKSLQSHIQKKHNKIIKCPICLSVYACHLKYVTHFNKCDKGNGFPCGVRKCKKVFQNGDYLISHLKKKHVFR